MRFIHPDVSQDTARRVAAEVRAEMGRQGISQETLRARLGWSQPRMSRRLIARSTAVPFDVGELAAVAAALDVPITKFLVDEPAAASAA